jgi:hypothetical protein
VVSDLRIVGNWRVRRSRDRMDIEMESRLPQALREADSRRASLACVVMTDLPSLESMHPVRGDVAASADRIGLACRAVEHREVDRKACRDLDERSVDLDDVLIDLRRRRRWLDAPAR